MDLRVLVIDGDPGFCELVHASLELEDWSVSWCTRGEDGLERACEQCYDAIILDVSLPDTNGLHVCRRILENVCDIPVIVTTALGDMASVISAMRAGACDFLNKPIEMAQLRSAVERAVRQRYRREAVQRLARAEPRCEQPIQGLIGDSRAMLKIHD